MKKMKCSSKTDILSIAIIVLLVISILTSSYMIYQYTKYTKVANGIYFTSNKTAVINMDRTWAEVMETCNHEYLHYKHFQHFEVEQYLNNNN